MKLRIDAGLYGRLKECADAIDESASEFARLAVVNLQKGVTRSVAVPLDLANATRENSVVMTISSDLVSALPPMEVRLAIAKAVIFAERRRLRKFETDLVEGSDFIIGAVK